MSNENFIIQGFGWLIGIPLEFLVVSAVICGPYRRFPLVLCYPAATFVTTLVEIPLYTESRVTRDAAVFSHAARIYWINDWILQMLVFAVVISLIDQAAYAARSRRVMRAGLTAAAILFAGISLR